jgi:hypothetical protein
LTSCLSINFQVFSALAVSVIRSKGFESEIDVASLFQSWPTFL